MSDLPDHTSDRPRFIAHKGDVWRKSEHGWHSMMPKTCEGLLSGFREDAANTTDWFHKRATSLAKELEAAVITASQQRQERKVA